MRNNLIVKGVYKENPFVKFAVTTNAGHVRHNEFLWFGSVPAAANKVWEDFTFFSWLPSRKAWFKVFWYELSEGLHGDMQEIPYYMRTFKIMPDRENHGKFIRMDSDFEDGRCVKTNAEILELLEKQHSFAFAPCYCRMSREIHTGKPCEQPFDGCLYTNEFAEYYISIGEATRLSKEEAKEKIIEAGKLGLVHLSVNFEEEIPAICSCCKCCCRAMRSMQRGEVQMVMPSKYLAAVDEFKCKRCGVCVEACPTNAVVFTDPLAFSKSDAVIINKVDLLPYVNMQMDCLRGQLAQINPSAHVFEVSSLNKTGFEELLNYIRDKVYKKIDCKKEVKSNEGYCESSL